MTARTLTVAAIQMASGSWHFDDNMATAERLIRAAAAQGARLIVCPELFMMPYFCIDQNAQHLALAEPFADNPRIRHFAALAGELGVVLPIGFFERAGNAAYNSVAVADTDGRILGIYRKTHIPDGPGYTEKYYFTPGDTGFKVWDTNVGKIGIGICWDQWYPETARAMALMGAEVLCFPTIIGSEPFSADYDSCGHWQRTMQGHAAANMLPLVAANRIGRETGIGNGNPQQQALTNTFYGSSFIADHTGAKLAEAGRSEEAILLASFNLDAIRAERQSWGFFRDRRPQMYRSLLTSDGVTTC
ncbi:N-carbamoylputrescine amidase [Craterilacuibacter sp. RT1T]|uniref:N-carbamoylputrescine amidase n=1 Tax=Craterilacuibacter sp. RT1T TaxID=2942211 RepID=UPI0020BEA68D|nr:N-carbamoylputrescine amidase [Craterilacuibacter sp. RT1T]MCL6262619.1 N-carbamoylputrescine amidase [Craterilacuibacter sp. RT1T]